MDERRDDELPFDRGIAEEPEIIKPPASPSDGSSRPGTAGPSSRLPISALAILVLLAIVLGYATYRSFRGQRTSGTGQELTPVEEPADLGEAASDREAPPDHPAAEEPVAAGTERAAEEPAAEENEPAAEEPPPARAGNRPVEEDPLALARDGDYAAAARLWARSISEGNARSSYTVQVTANCERGNIQRLFGTAGPDSDLFLLPVSIQGRSCYRVCRGLYNDRASAESFARALSAGKREGAPAARAVAVADVLPR